MIFPAYTMIYFSSLYGVIFFAWAFVWPKTYSDIFLICINIQRMEGLKNCEGPCWFSVVRSKGPNWRTRVSRVLGLSYMMSLRSFFWFYDKSLMKKLKRKVWWRNVSGLVQAVSIAPRKPAPCGTWSELELILIWSWGAFICTER